jgi:hypothetical protein
MFINTVFEIPETITGLIGAAFIGASILSSIKHNKTTAPTWNVIVKGE